MNVRASGIVGGLMVLLSASGYAGGGGQRTGAATAGSGALAWTLRLNETRGPVRAADL